MKKLLLAAIALSSLALTALPCTGPCTVPNCPTHFTVCHNTDGTTTITIHDGHGHSVQTTVSNGSSWQVGGFGTAILPNSNGNGTWGGVSQCSDVSGICSNPN